MLVKMIAVVTACFALAPVATAADSSPTAQPTTARDSFVGQITSATGRLAGNRDRVQMLLRTTGSDSKAVTISLAGRRCDNGRHCSRVAGTLRGTMLRRVSMPDTGAQFALNLEGNVRPLGHVTATGTVRGTGFVMYGYESLHLTLTNASASVTIDARSRRVPGFTSP